MLQIQNIAKHYKTGDLIQHALNGVSLNFRDNEFVSILGPSGSGKTTLLNIVGGLDRYDSGDLIINNVSTKDYKDRDWDSYRNHTIGFVFQSYNLIPHQTVLANVELALTIGGISKKERKQRALEALDKVGLKEQAHKRPTQMSGGQMQRVAIARALVNNPDILLADEPTGALDTETSVQVMELLKEVANDRLVIMVTHNPELAEEYSTRIVKLKDGNIIDDSNPFNPNTEGMEPPKHKNLGKASMSFLTALSLSRNNLMTKKARTLLTAFAGSIGIIGIALILALSTGFKNYIDKIQEDTLTSYPLTITSETADVTSALLAMVSETGEAEGTDIVSEKRFISNMFSNVGKNDLKAFKEYLEKNQADVDEMVSLVDYDYTVRPIIYTKNPEGEMTKLNPNSMLESLSGGSAVSTMMASSTSSIFNEMIEDREALAAEYDVLAGKWPDAYDEAILVLTEPNGITDILVYSLGLRENDELRSMITKIMAGEAVENEGKPLQFTYSELMAIPLKVVDATATYKYNEEYDIYEDMSGDKTYMEKVYEDALDLKIVGIVCAKEGSNSMMLTSGVAYTKDLTKYIISEAEKSEIVAKQMKDRNVNVFSGKRFDEDEAEAGLSFEDMISVDTDALSSAFGAGISEDDIKNMTQGYMGEISGAITTDTTKAQNDFNATLVTMATDMLNSYVDSNYNEAMQVAMIRMSDVDSVVESYMKSKNAKKLLAELSADYVIPADTFATMYEELLKGILQGYIGMAAMNMNQGAAVPQISTDAESAVNPENTALTESANTAEFETEDADNSVPEENAEEGVRPQTASAEVVIPDEVLAMLPPGVTKEMLLSMEPAMLKNMAPEVYEIIYGAQSNAGAADNTVTDGAISSEDDTVKEENAEAENSTVENATTEESTIEESTGGAESNSTVPETKEEESTEKEDDVVQEIPTIGEGNSGNSSTGAAIPGTGQISSDTAAPLTKEMIATAIPQLLEQEAIKEASKKIASGMVEAVMQKTILTKVGELTGELMGSMASAFNVDQDAIASAFQFDLSEEELTRLMETMTAASVETNADTNLLLLGYQDIEKPSMISFYFRNFDSKELFVEFIKEYNERMEKEDEEKVINYTDITGILISSVSTIVDSVTYVLIAFVSISLVVSSIMIGIITYISVLERTKEIGVLRAIGASKGNITSIFNAETFIVGLCSGLIGIGVTLSLVPLINYVIHSITNNYDINAVLPMNSAIILVILSVVLTLVGGFIPSMQAAKKDPVLALRSE